MTNKITFVFTNNLKEPKDMRLWEQLQHGLQLLNQADSCVEVSVLETGEYCVCALGELHMERCLFMLVLHT